MCSVHVFIVCVVFIALTEQSSAREGQCFYEWLVRRGERREEEGDSQEPMTTKTKKAMT